MFPYLRSNHGYVFWFKMMTTLLCVYSTLFVCLLSFSLDNQWIDVNKATPVELGIVWSLSHFQPNRGALVNLFQFVVSLVER